MADTHAVKEAAATAAVPTQPRGEVTVRFARQYKGWARGVEAGFTPTMADLLHTRGIAVIIQDDRGVPTGGRMIRKG